MCTPYSYAEAKAAVIGALARDASLHDQGLFAELGASFDELDARIPRSAGAVFDKLLIALRFLDDWLDASNHDWQYHQPMQRSDWPTLARTLIADISADREISDAAVLKHFVRTQ